MKKTTKNNIQNANDNIKRAQKSIANLVKIVNARAKGKDVDNYGSLFSRIRKLELVVFKK